MKIYYEIQWNSGLMQTLDRTGNNLLMKNKIPIKMIKCNLIISIIIQAVSKIYYSNLKNHNLFHQSSLLNKYLICILEILETLKGPSGFKSLRKRYFENWFQISFESKCKNLPAHFRVRPEMKKDNFIRFFRGNETRKIASEIY